ncbi:hypothetical protein SCA6_011527 [Theobroma cacao]
MSSCIDVAPEQLCYIPCNFCNIVLASKKSHNAKTREREKERGKEGLRDNYSSFVMLFLVNKRGFSYRPKSKHKHFVDNLMRTTP